MYSAISHGMWTGIFAVGLAYELVTIILHRWFGFPNETLSQHVWQTLQHPFTFQWWFTVFVLGWLAIHFLSFGKFG